MRSGVGAFACLFPLSFAILEVVNSYGDGYPDIFVLNDGMEQFLFRNKGDGTFEERPLDVGVALSDNGKAYAGMGVDFRDYDNDGKPDVVVTEQIDPSLFRNHGGREHWLTIVLHGTMQYAQSAGSYLSASDKRVHFGLGDVKKADIEIWWPSGARQRLSGVDVDRFLNVEEPK